MDSWQQLSTHSDGRFTIQIRPRVDRLMRSSTLAMRSVGLGSAEGGVLSTRPSLEFLAASATTGAN